MTKHPARKPKNRANTEGREKENLRETDVRCSMRIIYMIFIFAIAFVILTSSINHTTSSDTGSRTNFREISTSPCHV